LVDANLDLRIINIAGSQSVDEGSLATIAREEGCDASEVKQIIIQEFDERISAAADLKWVYGVYPPLSQPPLFQGRMPEYPVEAFQEI